MEKLPQTSSTSSFIPWDVQLPVKAPTTHQGLLPEKQEKEAGGKE